MKKLLLSFILFAFCAIAFAQAPQKMSYQAMIRNNNNLLIINQTIGMRISIIQGTINGNAVYTERQTPTTNNIGLISIEIGSNPSGLNFNTINWVQGPYFIKTEIDPTGGNNYTINGAAELLSVPYALYADKANTITGVLPIENGGTGANNLKDLKNNIGLNLKADLKSPSFYGIPVAPTPVLGTNNAQIATTAFVARSITKANVQPASSSVLGTIKLAGDLGGTADLPIILNDKITTNKIANNNVTNEKILSLDANKITGILSVAKGGTGDTSVSGLKNLLKIDKIDNTADNDKPVSGLMLAALNLKLNKADTLLLSNRINSKLAKTDTLSLSNRINSKLAKTDTASLSNRINSKLAKADTLGLSNRINTKLAKADTLGLSNRINSKLAKADTAGLSNRINTKLAKTDTVGLSIRINTKLAKTDTLSLSNRINTKLAKADTLALSNRINSKLAKADTTSLSVRINQKLIISDTTSLRNGINARATIASPTFTGTPLAPTATAGTSSTQIATTAFVQDAFTSFATSNGSSGSILAGAIWTSSTTGTLNGVGFTMTQLRDANPSNWDMSTSDFSAAPLSATQNSGTISHGDDWVVTFASPISDLKLYCKYWRTASYVFSQPLTLLSSGNGLTSPNSNTVTVGANAWGNGIVQFAGPITTLSVNSSASLINDASGQILTFGVGSVGPASGTGEIIRSANPTFTGTVSGITKAMVGLGNVDNTSDMDKPISTATQTALDDKVTKSNTRVAIGYYAGDINQQDYSVAIGSNASKDGQGTQSVAVGFASNSYADNATAIGGYATAHFLNSTALGYQAVTNTNNTIQLGADGTNGSTAITNVKTSGTLTAGTITYPNTAGSANQILTTDGSGTASWTTPTKAMVSLGSVDNTSDRDKPISRLTQTVLNTKLSFEVSDEVIASAGQTSFTLSYSPGANSKVKMYINGIRISNAAYSFVTNNYVTTLTYDPINNGAYALIIGDRIQFDFSY